VEAPIAGTNNGVFFHNSAITPKTIRDGLSQTIFLGEKAIDISGQPELGWMSGTRATLRNTGNGLGGGGMSVGAGTLAAARFVGAFGSSHPGTTNFAFGDGHVATLSVSIAPGVLSQLGHRADGKLLSEDF
jgi:prepilin-type processing-associated H-X9-DG protein